MGPLVTNRTAGIRRLDWRFLLADPRLRSVVTLSVDDNATDDELTEGLGQLGASPVGAEDVGVDGVSVVFVRDPGDGGLARALELRAGRGEIVVESTTRRGRWVAERRLRRAGLHVQSYGAWPHAAVATRFVPLDDRSELIASARAAKNRRRRTIGVLLTQLGLGSLVFAESTSVAGPDDEHEPPGPLRVAFGDGRVAAGTMTLLTPRFASSRHVIALATDRTGRSLVVKTPRVPSDDRQLRWEARGLKSIPAGGPPRPHLVVDTEWSGQRWIVQTRIDGEPLSRRHVTRHPDHWVAAASRWLVRMPTAEWSTPDADGRSERLLQPTLEVIAAHTSREPRLGELLDDAERAVGVVRSVPLPIVCEHGDFRPPNLVVTSPTEITAVDWELAERSGFPLHDLLFFHGYVASVVPELRDRLRRSARQALLELDVESELFEPLAAIASLRHLATEAVRLAGESDGPPRAVGDSPIAAAWFEALRSASPEGSSEVAST